MNTYPKNKIAEKILKGIADAPSCSLFTKCVRIKHNVLCDIIYQAHDKRYSEKQKSRFYVYRFLDRHVHSSSEKKNKVIFKDLYDVYRNYNNGKDNGFIVCKSVFSKILTERGFEVRKGARGALTVFNIKSVLF